MRSSIDSVGAAAAVVRTDQTDKASHAIFDLRRAIARLAGNSFARASGQRNEVDISIGWMGDRMTFLTLCAHFTQPG